MFTFLDLDGDADDPLLLLPRLFLRSRLLLLRLSLLLLLLSRLLRRSPRLRLRFVRLLFLSLLLLLLLSLRSSSPPCFSSSSSSAFFDFPHRSRKDCFPAIISLKYCETGKTKNVWRHREKKDAALKLWFDNNTGNNHYTWIQLYRKFSYDLDMWKYDSSEIFGKSVPG